MLFDSDATVEDFGRLQLCESVRAVLLHQDYELDLGAEPSMAALSSWIVESADWDLGLDLFRQFGNAGPESAAFTGTPTRCAPLSVCFMSCVLGAKGVVDATLRNQGVDAKDRW